MRQIRMIVIGLCLFVVRSVYAQVPESIPALTVDMQHVPLLHILSELEKQTGLFFSYESSLVDEYRDVSLTVREADLQNCLKRLFAPLPLSWQVTGRYIILKRALRQYTISGFVRDSSSYESLIAASVMDELSGKGVVTNNYGFYSLTLLAGKIRLSTSYVGFEPATMTFELTKDTLIDLPLKARSRLEEIVIEGTHSRSELSHARLGMLTLTPKEVKQVPSLLGEPDLIKTLQMTPGVAMGTETMADLYVRGGDSDENLIWMDGVPLYQVGHLGGLFSTFNPDVVKLAGFYKGSFPACFGERLSSVVDVRTNEGDMYHYHGNATLGLIAGNMNLSGPIVKGRTSFNVAVRRTWMDAILSPMLAVIRKVGDGGFDSYFRYAFQDVNLKINHKLSEQGRLEAGLYYGDDFMKMNEKPVVETSYPYRNYSWRWGNLSSFLNWNQAFSQKLFGNATLFYSRYRSKVDNWKENSWEVTYSSQKRSRIEDVGVRFLLDYMPRLSHHLKGGTEYLFHIYRPEQVLGRRFFTRKMYGYGNEWALFAEDDWNLTSRLRMNLGIRFSYFHTQQAGYASLRPRVSLRYRLFPHLSLKASYSEMNQYIHQLGDTYASLPTDIWLPVTGRIRPMYSRIVSAGLYSDRLDGYVCSIEGFHKTMNRVLDYTDYRYMNSVLDPIDEQITEGRRRSYGVEMMVKKTTGKLTGWAGYTLSWTDCLFPALNEGKRFPFRYDNRHKLNIVAAYKLNPKIELTAAWSYASGNHLTFLLERYYMPDDPLSGIRSEYVNYGYDYFDWGMLGFDTSKRNNVQLPAYHRLDLGINISRPLKKGRMGVWSIGLYNAYCRMNPIALQITYRMEPGQDKPQAVLQTYSLLPVIPSVSYTYKF